MFGATNGGIIGCTPGGICGNIPGGIIGGYPLFAFDPPFTGCDILEFTRTMSTHDKDDVTQEVPCAFYVELVNRGSINFYNKKQYDRGSSRKFCTATVLGRLSVFNNVCIFSAY